MTTTPSQTAPDAAPEHEDILRQLNGNKDALAMFLKELEAEDAQAPQAAQPPGAPAATPSRELARPMPARQRADTQPEAESEAESADEPPTEEELTSIYGSAVVEAAKSGDLDLWQWDQDVRAGKDTSANRAALAKHLGIPEPLIEQYEAAARPAATSPEQSPAATVEANRGFTDLEVQGLNAIAGGDEGFQALSAWASDRLKGDPLLADYNTAVNEGNALAARLALRVMVQAHREDTGHEPALLQGQGAPRAGGIPFSNFEELQEAMNADRKNGIPRYYRDPKYREEVNSRLAKSSLLA